MTFPAERLIKALGDHADASRLLPLTVDLRDEAAVEGAVRAAGTSSTSRPCWG